MSSGPSRGGGGTNIPIRVPDAARSGTHTGVPHIGPWNPPTGTTAVSHNCVGFCHSWACGHSQNSLHDSNGCLLEDDPALLNHVHFVFDLGDDDFPCPICPQIELPMLGYYPPVAEIPGHTSLDDIQWRVDAMAHDPYFRQLKAEVNARTPVPEPVDPWRREEPKDLDDLWQDTIRLGMRLMQMRGEPRGPGSGPPTQPAPQIPTPPQFPPPGLQAIGSQQPMGSGRQMLGPTVAQAQQAPALGSARSRSSLNPATAFRGEFVPGNVSWTHNRLSRRQAARARHEWSLAHSQRVWTAAQPPTAPGQAQPTPPQFRGLVMGAHPQPTRMQQMVTAADLEEVERRLGETSVEMPGASGGASGEPAGG